MHLECAVKGCGGAGGELPVVTLGEQAGLQPRRQGESERMGTAPGGGQAPPGVPDIVWIFRRTEGTRHRFTSHRRAVAVAVRVDASTTIIRSSDHQKRIVPI